jgi:hypothetical protein
MASISTSGFAADAIATTGARDLGAASQAHVSVQAAASAAHSATKTLVAVPLPTAPNELFVNPNRAYPPSCLNAPFDTLGLWQGDSNALQAQVKLIGDPYSGSTSEANYVEADTVTLFRVVCSSGLSATLLEIDRPLNVDGNTNLYPTFPGVSVAQGANNVFIRLAADPNTFLSATYALTPVVNSQVFVLENFYGGSAQFNFNNAFALTVDTFNTADPNRFTTYNLGTYTPPVSPLALPISGYMTSNWFDPQHGGEGTLTQIFDNNDGQTRTFTAAWYTFDKTGLPFWLYTQGTIHIGDRSTGNVDTFYAKNGGFAGVGDAGATFTKWGTINFNFPDCDHMSFTFSGNADAVNGPTGSGTRSWLRIANLNGLYCK